MLLGHWVGDKLNDETFHRFKHWFMIGAIVLAAVLAGYIVWKRRSHRPAQLPAETPATNA